MILNLHIGNHKTGSTAIQSVLETNQLLLKKSGIIYPHTGKIAGAHHGIVASLKEITSESFQKHTNNATTEWRFEELLEQLRLESKGFSEVVISSEEFFNYASLNNDKCKIFLAAFDKVKIIVYLRNQIDHIESSYKFSIAWDKEKENRSFEEYLDVQLNSQYHEYLPTLEYWSSFPNTEVKCVSFDEEKSTLLNSFLYIINKSNLYSYIDTTKVSRNSSPSTFETIILKEFKGKEDLNSVKRTLARLANGQNGNINTLYTFDQFLQMRDKFKKSNEELHQKYGINLNKHVPNPKDKIFINQFNASNAETLQDLITLMLR